MSAYLKLEICCQVSVTMTSIGLWLVLAGLPLLLGLWAQRRVSSTFKQYSQIPTANGMSGEDAAAAVLRASGLEGVKIEHIDGRLSDHYDPRSRTLRLSADVGQARTVAALGVAAHEAGHALQHAQGYRPMTIRQTLVPAAQFGQSLWFLPVVIGLLVGATGLVQLGVALFAAVVLFQLVTLPVEFDASRRALVGARRPAACSSTTSSAGARKVLNAAALTYVAGFVAALGQLVYFFLLSRD